ncbi:MAG TPA: porin family protein [Arachidicoccus sp.]
MKRKLLAFAIIIFVCSKGFGQDKGNVEYGVGVGIGSSTVSDGDGNTNSSDRTVFNAGISGDYYFSNRWSLKAKLQYDQKGWNNGYLNDLNSGNSYIENYHLNYLSVPVMANWHFGATRNWYLNFGPYIGFLLSAKTSPDNYDVKPLFHTVDGGIAFGVGVKIPLSNQVKFFIEMDGQGSAANIVKTTDGSSLNNSRGSFNIGINFL